MRRILSACTLLAALAACAAAPDQGPPATGRLDAGATILGIVGTPFLIALKVPVCLATVVIAAPVASASELADPNDPNGPDLRRDLDDGVAENCGPPYVVTP